MAPGIEITDEAVKTYRLGEWDHDCCVRAGLERAAPLTAAQTLSQEARTLHQGLAGICHPECPGCRLERRADELERGTDR